MITVEQQRDSTGQLTPGPATRPAVDQCNDSNEFLTALRKEFPHWGIMPGGAGVSWVAIQGKNVTIEGADGIELRDKLLIVASSRYGRRK